MSEEAIERESMSYDVVIVGAGPSGLAAAIRLKQIAAENEREIGVCVLEKGSEVGAHILSGAVLETRALDELLPDWRALGAPVTTEVSDEKFLFLRETTATTVPTSLLPPSLKNHGNYIISLGNLCRWLGEQAAELGAEVFPGFAAAQILYHEDGSVKGVATGDMGVDAQGVHKDSYEPGFEFHAKYTVFAEGCRGHLGKELIERFKLDQDADPQHYGIGLKEIWEIDPARHKEGLVVHTAGYPMIGASYAGSSGGFLYHTDNNQVSLGLIVDLGYSNPHISPFDEFQKFKQHPVIKQYIDGGKRLSYGARALNKGGLNSLPKMTFPGGLLIGCDAGTLNAAKIKGSHTAMKSGMIAAESLVEALKNAGESVPERELGSYAERFRNSNLYTELYKTRNFSAGFHKLGFWLGSALVFIEHNLFGGKFPMTFHDRTPDYAQLKTAAQSTKIDYPKPDGKISFDKLSSVFLSNTNHAENQPCHLHLKDPSIPIGENLPKFDEPAQRYCPAGVYEVVEEADGSKRFQINSQNCVHCKTCDIKDPAQNIHWVTPEGGGGPNYPNM